MCVCTGIISESTDVQNPHRPLQERKASKHTHSYMHKSILLTYMHAHKHTYMNNFIKASFNRKASFPCKLKSCRVDALVINYLWFKVQPIQRNKLLDALVISHSWLEMRKFWDSFAESSKERNIITFYYVALTPLIQQFPVTSLGFLERKSTED